MRHENKYLKFDRDVKTSHHVLLHIQCDGRVICFHILQHQIWAIQIRRRQNRAPNYGENDFGKSCSVNVTTLNWTLCTSVLLSGSCPVLWGSSWFHPTFFPRLCINHSLSLSLLCSSKARLFHLLKWIVSPSAISSPAAWKQEHPSVLAHLTSAHPSAIRCHSLRSPSQACKASSAPQLQLSSHPIYFLCCMTIWLICFTQLDCKFLDGWGQI